MEVENIFVSISEKLNTLIFALDTNYNVSKVKNQFQSSVYCNGRFSGIKATFKKYNEHYDKLIAGKVFNLRRSVISIKCKIQGVNFLKN